MTSPETPRSPTRRRRSRLDLSATQVIASALAAVTATVAASYLGVSGTVIGAAVASVLTVVGNAVYGHSLRTTRDRVRATVPPRFPPPTRQSTVPGGASEVWTPTVLSSGSPAARSATRPWPRFALGTVAAFAAVLALVTGIELAAGRPLSDLLRGDSGSGTTLFGANDPARSHPTPSPTVTRTVTPSVVVVTPTVTRTAAPVTRTAAPATPSTPTPSAALPTPSAPSTQTGTGTGTGTGTAAPSPIPTG